MKKKVQVHLIDANSINDFEVTLIKDSEGFLAITSNSKSSLRGGLWSTKDWGGYKFPYLYFTSDKDKKDGDKCICLDEIRSNLLPENKNRQVSPFVTWKSTNNCNGCRKIVATTNPELYKTNSFTVIGGAVTSQSIPTNIARIGDDFIEVYIKAYNEGKPITEVMLEYVEEVDERLSEHPLSSKFGEIVYKYPLKLRSNGTVIISPVVEEKFTITEVIELLKFFTADTRGDKPWVDADDEWVEHYLTQPGNPDYVYLHTQILKQ